MPGNLHVRNLDDELIARLKRRAARHGRNVFSHVGNRVRGEPHAQSHSCQENRGASKRDGRLF